MGHAAPRPAVSVARTKNQRLQLHDPHQGLTASATPRPAPRTHSVCNSTARTKDSQRLQLHGPHQGLSVSNSTARTKDSASATPRPAPRTHSVCNSTAPTKDSASATPRPAPRTQRLQLHGPHLVAGAGPSEEERCIDEVTQVDTNAGKGTKPASDHQWGTVFRTAFP